MTDASPGKGRWGSPDGYDDTTAERLKRFSARRLDTLRAFGPRSIENLAFQKETLGLALEIAGISKDELLSWVSKSGPQRSFLDGLPGVQVREDAMLLADFSNLPGFDSLGDVTHYGTKMFVKQEDPSVRLTVIMANRFSLEQQTGADLIYFNETYQSFVLVQYKAMEKRNARAEFRWQDGDQFTSEIARMDTVLTELNKIQSREEPDGYRFSKNPFFLKFCPRVVFNPDDKGLFSGIYLPIELWKLAVASGRLRGENGGNVLTFENIGRRITNSEFVSLVSGSWVGTSVEQSAVLASLIRKILSSGKTVTFAIKHASSSEFGATRT